MKLKNIISYSLIMLLFSFITAQVVTYQLTGNYIFMNRKTNEVAISQQRCADMTTETRPDTKDPQLRAVAEYEAACGSKFLDGMMLFSSMPISRQNAQEMADAMTIRIKAFSEFSVRPIVIVEPDSEWGLVDFHEYASGFYDQWIDDYFARLVSNGITDEQIGIWIPFPEPQQDFWNNNSDPDDFALSINRYFGSLRKYYPSAMTAILLDSQTGEAAKTPQLLAYTRLIQDGLVDYAGLQGFPWHPIEEGDTRTSVTSADEFLPAGLAEDVAKSLNVNKIFLNTGTYRHKKLANGGFLSVTTRERYDTLNGIFRQVDQLRKDNYDVVINLFAENKLDSKEGVNWSYWQNGQYGQSEHTALFSSFIRKMHDSDVLISIYDSRL